MIRFVPYQKIGNLVTVISIYLSCGIYYFLKSSPTVLFLIVLEMGIVLWLNGLYDLHTTCRKWDECTTPIDMKGCYDLNETIPFSKYSRFCARKNVSVEHNNC